MVIPAVGVTLCGFSVEPSDHPVNTAPVKDIGLKARRDIEKLLNKHVYLELFVKVQSDWRNNDSLLETYGYKNKKQ